MERALKGVLFNLNRLLRAEIHQLDRILKEFEVGQYKEYALLAGVSQFTKLIAEKLFGIAANEVFSDYNRLTKLLTSAESGQAARGIEALRHYYIKILNSRFHYNPLTGEDNLDDLANVIISTTDLWVRTIERNDPRVFNDLIDYFKGEARLVRALLFFALIMLISSIALKWRFEQIEGGEKICNIITKIYYGHALASEQYLNLRQMDLLGGIIFRGISCDLRRALKISKMQSIRPKGISWSSNYYVAKKFARAEDFSGAPVNSLAEFKNLYEKGYRKFEIYQKVPLMSILEFIEGTVRASGRAYPSGGAMVGFIFSQMLDKKSLIYFGRLSPEEFRSRFYGEEEILAHSNIKLTDYSVDAFVSIYA